jgi:hypothetical protein
VFLNRSLKFLLKFAAKPVGIYRHFGLTTLIAPLERLGSLLEKAGKLLAGASEGVGVVRSRRGGDKLRWQ